MTLELANKIASRVLYFYTKKYGFLTDEEILELRRGIVKNIMQTTEERNPNDSEFEDFWDFNQDREFVRS